MKFNDTPFCVQESVLHPRGGRQRGPGRALSRLAAAALLLAASAAAQAAPVLWSGNGHYYERILGSYTWDAARAAAAASSFNGMQGYLATITSAAENSFVITTLGYGWLGGSDAAQEGVWKWMTGPEAGQTFTYTNWDSLEPNNGKYIEHYVMILGNSRWNDLYGGSPVPYIVEYSPSAVPEPGTLALLGAGGMAALARRRRKSL